MPTYQYHCQDCGQTTSIARRINEEELVPICFRCKKQMTRRYSFGAVTFNGQGFYRTDSTKDK